MSIRTCKIYKILNRVQESENVMIRGDSYLKKSIKIWNFKLFVIEKELLKLQENH